MIKEVTFYKVLCDKCGYDSTEGTDYAAWSDEAGAEACADDAGYSKTADGRYLCPDCTPRDAE